MHVHFLVSVFICTGRRMHASLRRRRSRDAEVKL